MFTTNVPPFAQPKYLKLFNKNKTNLFTKSVNNTKRQTVKSFLFDGHAFSVFQNFIMILRHFQKLTQ